MRKDQFTKGEEKYMEKTRYEYLMEIEEILDDALSGLSPSAFDGLKDDIAMILDDYEAPED